MRVTYFALCIVAFGIVGVLADANRRYPNFKSSSKEVEEWFFSQPVDHFTPLDNRTFGMRFLTQNKYFADNGPIFIMVGGQWRINDQLINGGYLNTLGKEMNAYLVHTEHRYYGESRVINTLGTYNLRFIKTEQLLADVIRLVKSMKNQPHLKESKVIVFGGAHGGNLATWLRLKHPELIDGAVASSAPLLAKVDFFESLEVVQDALSKEGGPGCAQVVKDAVTDIIKHMETDDGIVKLIEKFRLCKPIDRLNPLDVQSFFYMITTFMSDFVVRSIPSQMTLMCSKLNDPTDAPIDRLSKAMEYFDGGACNVADYKTILEAFSNTDVSSKTAQKRLRLYQACTALGQFQTTTSANQPFGDTLPLRFFLVNLCPDAFGIGIGVESAESGTAITNQVYGGLKPNVTKVVWTQGSIDPWHTLGINANLNEESPAFVATGESHVADLADEKPTDSGPLKEARAFVRNKVMEWVSA